MTINQNLKKKEFRVSTYTVYKKNPDRLQLHISNLIILLAAPFSSEPELNCRVWINVHLTG